MVTIATKIYEGQLVDNKPHGKGMVSCADGSTYDGYWGKVRGKGYANDIKYEGDMVVLPHGKGILMFADGSKYEGDFENGKLHGRGIMMFADGKTHDGDWVDGLPHGKGTFTFAEGGKYEVHSENGKILEIV